MTVQVIPEYIDVCLRFLEIAKEETKGLCHEIITTDEQDRENDLNELVISALLYGINIFKQMKKQSESEKQNDNA